MNQDRMDDDRGDEDEVDELVADWRRERPELDVSSLEIWSRISRLAAILVKERARAYAEHDLTVWEFDVLSALRKLGAPYSASVGHLIRDNHVTSGTMTNRLDRLAGRGMITRHADPHDLRSRTIELTPLGLERVDAAIESLVAVESRMLDGLAVDRDQLVRQLRALLTVRRQGPR
ncbi:MarR family protein [Propionibacterium acidifaciens F0233]|uniref:MarR family protein n=1 Tax=Propionibacterium acidifaciens F0233 TaxID=553198 RepID=U2QYY7_9ACTN|nr:MarR family winged helix-turn-helix transcriptional regulator [Propionibacterium acidifaciens]ERK61404.1 MarR family protein [Propionibacterium acidifaciens F0233]